MQANALDALEFDRIVELVTDLTVTGPGRHRAAELTPLTDAGPVVVARWASRAVRSNRCGCSG